MKRKMTIGACAVMSNILASIAAKADNAIVDNFIALMPHVQTYTDALKTMQQDARGKSECEQKELTSVQAFERICETEVEVDLSVIPMDEMRKIVMATPVLATGCFKFLMPMIKD